eukprot:2269151-Karenia_brevis.AAC.1
MKWWALKGFSCCDKATHYKLKSGSFQELPSDEALEDLRRQVMPAGREPSPEREDDNQAPHVCARVA